MSTTTRPNPDFKLLYFYLVLLGSLAFFCGSVYGLITTVTNYYYPSYPMNYKMDSKAICSGQMGMVKDPNVVNTKTDKEMEECIKDNEELATSGQKSMYINGLTSSGTATFISLVVWLVHFKLLQRYEQSYNRKFEEI
jgi:hypothetical protein